MGSVLEAGRCKWNVTRYPRCRTRPAVSAAQLGEFQSFTELQSPARAVRGRVCRSPFAVRRSLFAVRSFRSQLPRDPTHGARSTTTQIGPRVDRRPTNTHDEDGNEDRDQDRDQDHDEGEDQEDGEASCTPAAVVPFHAHVVPVVPRRPRRDCLSTLNGTAPAPAPATARGQIMLSACGSF